MGSPVICRRRDRRYVLEPGTSWIEFAYPVPGGHPCRMALRDISEGGLSFVLALELPGLRVGRSIARAHVEVAGDRVYGDVLVMHLTPDAGPGSICGALFFPRGDENIVGLQKLIAHLAAIAG